MTTEYATKQRANKLEVARQFEKRLGIAAFDHDAARAAATAMLDGIMRAEELPESVGEDGSEEQKTKFVALFGSDKKGEAGQVGTDVGVVFDAVRNGNLREKMTAVYNAMRGEFKADLRALMKASKTDDQWAQLEERGLDAKALKRRKGQLGRPYAADLYRDPGNPLDRKNLLSFVPSTKQSYATGLPFSNTRRKNPEDQQQTERTVGDLEEDGVSLSEREKAFMFDGAADVGADQRLTWNEGGTSFTPNEKNKWVRKCKDRLHMPVIAGPSGSALRTFQVWEFLGQPTTNTHLRLALLGWMLTGNDHSFHEIMMTSADYGMPYKAGWAAYRDVAPLGEDELRAIAGDHGFPDEVDLDKGQITDEGDGHNSILVTPQHLARYQNLVTAGADVWASGAPPEPDQLAYALAVLAYTDEGEKTDAMIPGVSGYKFINNYLSSGSAARKLVFRYHLRREKRLWDQYSANKFNLQQLVGEAGLLADYMEEGLTLLKPFVGTVYRGERTNSLPRNGASWTSDKFLSMSTDKNTAKGFTRKGSGRYGVLLTVTSTSGRSLGHFSMMGNRENEVIFPKNTPFTYTSEPASEAALFATEDGPPEEKTYYAVDCAEGGA